MDNYSYILAELFKRNTQLHGYALKKKGENDTWPDIAIKTINKELRSNPLKSNTKLKAISGNIWGWLRTQNITTREVYQLILQWALYLTEKNLLFIYTKEYSDLLEDLKTIIEDGAQGAFEDVESSEIIKEWEFVQENFYSPLHNLCKQFIGI